MTELYTYQSLESEQDNIRLFILHKAQEEEPISGSLIECPITNGEERLPYEALSYTWQYPYSIMALRMFSTYGQNQCQDFVSTINNIVASTTPSYIELDGSNLEVGVNLFYALRHLREIDSDRVLWVDAICINQQDPVERNHQVRRMQRIYKHAEGVIVWLGFGIPIAEFALSKLGQYSTAKRGPKNSHLGDQKQNDRVPSSKLDGDPVLDGIRVMLYSNWFRRVWILQEVASAWTVKFAFGKASLSAHQFAEALQYLEFPSPHFSRVVLEIMPGYRDRPSSWWQRDRSLKNILPKFQLSEATDPRDKIFALVGLTDKAEEYAQYIVDYRLDEAEVIQRTLDLCLPKGLANDYTLCPVELRNMLHSMESLLPIPSFLCLLEHVNLILFFRAVSRNQIQDAAIFARADLVQTILTANADVRDEVLNPRRLLEMNGLALHTALIDILLSSGSPESSQQSKIRVRGYAIAASVPKGFQELLSAALRTLYYSTSSTAMPQEIPAPTEPAARILFFEITRWKKYSPAKIDAILQDDSVVGYLDYQTSPKLTREQYLSEIQSLGASQRGVTRNRYSPSRPRPHPKTNLLTSPSSQTGHVVTRIFYIQDKALDRAENERDSAALKGLGTPTDVYALLSTLHNPEMSKLAELNKFSLD